MVQVDVGFTAEEKQYLVKLLESRLGDTRVEVHRTHTPDFRDQVQQEEALLRNMIAKLQG